MGGWGGMWGKISVKSILEISKAKNSTELENTLKDRWIESAFCFVEVEVAIPTEG